MSIHQRVLTRDGEPVTLTPSRSICSSPSSLASAARHERRPASNRPWPDTFVEEANLTYNVVALRKALGDTSEPKQFVATVQERGYPSRRRFSQ